jgi:hypothetical protein
VPQACQVVDIFAAEQLNLSLLFVLHSSAKLVDHVVVRVVQQDQPANVQLDIQWAYPCAEIPHVSRGLTAGMRPDLPTHQHAGHGYRFGIAPLLQLDHDSDQRTLGLGAEKQRVDPLTAARKLVLQLQPEFTQARVDEQVEKWRPTVQPAPTLGIARAFSVTVREPPSARFGGLSGRGLDHPRRIADQSPVYRHSPAVLAELADLRERSACESLYCPVHPGRRPQVRL